MPKKKAGGEIMRAEKAENNEKAKGPCLNTIVLQKI
jgi:hypothetical protein